MLDTVEIDGTVVRKENVRQSLKRMNPAHKKQDRKPREDVIYVEKRRPLQ